MIKVTNSRKQAVKSTGNMGQTRVSAVHIEKSPLRASIRNGNNEATKHIHEYAIIY